MAYLITLSPFRKANSQKIYMAYTFRAFGGYCLYRKTEVNPAMKRILPALALALLLSVQVLTEDALLRSLLGWTAYFARIPAETASAPVLEWDWSLAGLWRALFPQAA